jgi:hypothetical protein
MEGLSKAPPQTTGNLSQLSREREILREEESSIQGLVPGYSIEGLLRSTPPYSIDIEWLGRMRFTSRPFHGQSENGMPYWSVTTYADAYPRFIGREGCLVSAVQNAFGVRISTSKSDRYLIIWAECRDGIHRIDKSIAARLDRAYHYLYLWVWAEQSERMPYWGEDFLVDFLKLEKENRLGNIPKQPLRPALPFLQNPVRTMSSNITCARSSTDNSREDRGHLETSRNGGKRRYEQENQYFNSTTYQDRQKRSLYSERSRRNRSRSPSSNLGNKVNNRRRDRRQRDRSSSDSGDHGWRSRSLSWEDRERRGRSRSRSRPRISFTLKKPSSPATRPLRQ